MGTCHQRVIKSKETKIITDRKCLNFGRKDLNLEGHMQMADNSKTM